MASAELQTFPRGWPLSAESASTASEKTVINDEARQEKDGLRQDASGPRQDDGPKAGGPNDVEKQQAPPQEPKPTRPADPDLVTWNGPTDPSNPKNWPMHRKWLATVTVSAFTFLATLSSSMLAPALPDLARDLNITTTIEAQAAFSVFILAFAVGPLVLAPLSEVYGRVRVLQPSVTWFLAWNLGCAFAQTGGQIIAFRFLAGLGASVCMAAGGGVLSDCWKPEQRGKAVGLYSLAPLLGPAIGPVAGGWIAQASTWHWVFWSTSIAAAVIQVLGAALLPETWAPTLLRRKAKRLRKETGNERLHTEADKTDETLSKKLVAAFVRPSRLLLTQPIVQMIALYNAYIFGLLYLLLSTFPTLWTEVYGESVGIAGLHYLSLGLGCLLGALASSRLSDAVYRRLKRRNSDAGRPEFRIPLMFGASALVPVGIFWYGWSAQAHTHWIVPDLGAAIFGFAVVPCLQTMQAYTIDCFGRFAASGLAAAIVLRSVAAFTFPLFATQLFERLGYGWGNTVLAFAGIVIGILAPFLFWFAGEKLRQRSSFTATKK